MTVFTSRFGFKWNYQPHDTGWGTDYNFAHRELAALLHPNVISDTVTTPPGSPAENDAYFVPLVGATGAWSANAGKIAAYQGGAWQYYTPEVGTRMHVVSRSAFYWWNGTALTAEATSGSSGTFVQTVAGHAPDIAGNVALVVADITGAAPTSSPALTGTPTAPTRAANNNSTGVATTEYVDRAITAIGGLNSVAAGTGINVSVSGGVYTVSINSSVVETVSALATALGSYLPLAGGTLTGDLHLAAPVGSDNTDKAVSSAWVRTYVTSLGFGTGTGTVTSVALTLPSWLSVSGSPITNSGTLAVTANTQTANTVLAGPLTGSAAAPTFRALVAADLPSGTPNTGTNQTWTAAQRSSITTLTDGATITPDFAATNNFVVTLGGNRTLANPSNVTAGQAGQIVVKQDATGSRTLAYGSSFRFAGGTAPTLTTAANAVDILSYYVWDTTHIAVSYGLAFA